MQTERGGVNINDKDEMMTDKNICEYANKSSAFENKPA